MAKIPKYASTSHNLELVALEANAILCTRRGLQHKVTATTIAKAETDPPKKLAPLPAIVASTVVATAAATAPALALTTAAAPTLAPAPRIPY